MYFWDSGFYRMPVKWVFKFVQWVFKFVISIDFVIVLRNHNSMLELMRKRSVELNFKT